MCPELALALPGTLALAGGVLALALDAFATARSAVWVASACLLAAGLAAGTAVLASETASVWSPSGDAEMLFVGSGHSATASVVFLAAGIALSAGASSLSRRPGGGTAAALIALAALGAAAVASSRDLALTLLAFETTALCAYALVAGARTPAADGAALRYFVQGAVATGIFVLGTAVLIGSGMVSTSLVPAPSSLDPGIDSVLIAGVMLLLAVYSFKAGAFPFHSWAPDAYEAAPVESASFLASAPKAGAIAALVILLAVVSTDTVLARPTTTALALLAAASVVFGNLVAVRQSSYRRMLAYSGIAHVGYALIGLTGALAAGWGVVGRATAVFFIATYALVALAAFLVAEAVERVRPDWDGTVRGLAGLARERTVLSVSLAVLMFSLAGIPPFIGFWGKLAVFTSAVNGGYVWLAVVGVLGSVVSFGFYGTVLRYVFFEDSEAHGARQGRPARAVEFWVAAVAVFATIAGLAMLWADLASVVERFSV
jgi:NADH-quinone oxidoreductase subunit N